MRLPLPLVAALVLGSGALPAQDARDPLSLIPGNAMAVGWVDGPAVLRAHYADTRLADLLTGPELGAILTPLLAMGRAQLAAQLDAVGLDAEELEQAAMEYGGRVTWAFGMDVDKAITVNDFGAPETDLAQADPWFVMIVSGNGQTDLAAAAERARELIEEHSVGLTDLSVEGHSYRVRKQNNLQTTLPIVCDGHLLVIGAHDLERAIPRCLSAVGKSLADRQVTLPKGPIGAWVELGPLFEKIVQATEGQMMSGVVQVAMQALGLTTIETATLVTRAGEEHTILELDLRLKGDDHGILDSLIAVGDTPPAVLDLVPVQRANWSVTKINPQKLLAAIQNIVDGTSEMSGNSWADIEDRFEGMFRVRIADDLIAHLGDAVLMFDSGNIDEAVDEDPRAAMASSVAGTCFGVTLKDPAAFGTAFEKILRSRGLHVARKTDDYRGFAVRRLPLLGMLELHYVITEHAILLATDESGARELRAFLDEERDRGEGKPRAAMPDHIAHRLEQAVQGWQSIGVTALPDTVDSVYQAMGMWMGRQGSELPGGPGIEQGIAMFRQLSKQYGLENTVSVTRCTPRRVLVQIIW